MAATFSTAVYIESPPNAVCAAISDIDSWKDWMPGLVAVEKLTPGPMSAGSEWRESRKIMGREATEHFRCTRWDPPARLDILVDGSRGSSRRGEYRFTYEFVPERTGTNVELVGDIRMPGIWAVMGKLMAGTMKRGCHQDLEALKAHLEKAITGSRGGRTAAGSRSPSR
jgi:carbon monoxide dehydrogenase subunit G